MSMALAGLANGMSAKPQDATSEGGQLGEKVTRAGQGGVLGRARVKQVLGKFVTSPSPGRGLSFV